MSDVKKIRLDSDKRVDTFQVKGEVENWLEHNKIISNEAGQMIASWHAYPSNADIFAQMTSGQEFDGFDAIAAIRGEMGSTEDSIDQIDLLALIALVAFTMAHAVEDGA